METPGIWRSRSRTKSRRRRYSASILGTESCGPRMASTAAFCAIEVGLDVLWLCSFVMAPMMGAGASAKPMRQPVMEYVFDNEPATTTVSFEPDTDAIENGWSSYRNWQ